MGIRTLAAGRMGMPAIPVNSRGESRGVDREAGRRLFSDTFEEACD